MIDDDLCCAECGNMFATTYVVTIHYNENGDPVDRTEICRQCDDELRAGNDVGRAVKDLWIREGGWIPGAAIALLAEAVGLELPTSQQIREETGPLQNVVVIG